jgi:hypothetical protein
VTEIFDERIVQQEEVVANLRAEMESLRKQFVGEIADFLGPWYTGRAREIVKKESAKAEALGSDGLRDLKREVEQLALSAREVAESVLDTPAHWWHLRGASTTPAERQAHYTDAVFSYRFRQRSDPPPALRNPLDDLLNELGKIMHERGFLDGGRGIRRSVATKSMEWPKRAVEIMAQYADRMSKVLAAERDIRRIQQAKSERSVDDLWDSL